MRGMHTHAYTIDTRVHLYCSIDATMFVKGYVDREKNNFKNSKIQTRVCVCLRVCVGGRSMSRVSLKNELPTH